MPDDLFPEGLDYYRRHVVDRDLGDLLTIQQLAALFDAYERTRLADAVARVWIVGLMESEVAEQEVPFKMGAHPLACVRAALGGETEDLGCKEDELRLALAHEDIEGYRAARRVVRNPRQEG